MNKLAIGCVFRFNYTNLSNLTCKLIYIDPYVSENRKYLIEFFDESNTLPFPVIPGTYNAVEMRNKQLSDFFTIKSRDELAFEEEEIINSLKFKDTGQYYWATKYEITLIENETIPNVVVKIDQELNHD